MRWIPVVLLGLFILAIASFGVYILCPPGPRDEFSHGVAGVGLIAFALWLSVTDLSDTISNAWK